jgi:putative acetyltransferase
MIHYQRTNNSHVHFNELVTLLDADLDRRYGVVQQEYSGFNRTATIEQVVIACNDDLPAGCGGLRRYNDDIVEIKRMFVKTEFRGSGMASGILRELEKWALELGYREARLETGIQQPEAIRFYEKSGFVVIENFGPYQGNDNSLCMAKKLI